MELDEDGAAAAVEIPENEFRADCWPCRLASTSSMLVNCSCNRDLFWARIVSSEVIWSWKPCTSVSSELLFGSVLRLPTLFCEL